MTTAVSLVTIDHLQYSSIQSLSCIWFFATPWTAACQASLSITNAWSLLKLMSIALVYIFNNKFFPLKVKWKWNSLSCVWLFVTPWTIAHQAPLSMDFSRQEYWSGLPCPPPGDLPNPGIEPRSPALGADSLPAEPQGKPKFFFCFRSIHCHNQFLLVNIYLPYMSFLSVKEVRDNNVAILKFTTNTFQCIAIDCSAHTACTYYNKILHFSTIINYFYKYIC